MTSTLSDIKIRPRLTVPTLWSGSIIGAVGASFRRAFDEPEPLEARKLFPPMEENENHA